jgi:RHS repeat-associated protein
VSGNNKIWRQFTFTPINTSNIRVKTTASVDGYSRITEVEAYGPAASSGSGSVRWLVTDHLGTPRMVLDQNGSLANTTRHDYLPFGEELFAPTGGRSAAQGYRADGVRQQFTQQERDAETGLDFFLARYHANIQGRFTSVDPLISSVSYGEPQSWNRYTYGLNNPLKYIDPTGMTVQEVTDERYVKKGWYVKKDERVKRPEWRDQNPGTDYEPIISNVWRSVESGKYYATNPFKNEIQAFDNAQDAMAAYQGYIINQALADSPRLPDAAQVSYGALWFGGTTTVDAYGQAYQVPLDIYARRPVASNYGKYWVPRPKWRFGVSFNFLWVDQFTTPTPAESRDAFTGPTLTFQGGRIVGGQYSFGSRNTVGIGLTTPGFGVVAAPHGYQLVPRARFRWR